MDALSEVLDTIHLRSALYCRAELCAPWGVRIGSKGRAKFHVVIEGGCWLEVDGGEAPLRLAAGDFVVLPQGTGHTLRDARATPALPLEDLLATLPLDQKNDVRYGGGGVRTTLLCGYFPVDGAQTNPLLRALPPVIHIQNEAGRAVPWLEATLKFITCESQGGRPGAQTILTRLSDILFIQAVRAHVASLSGCEGGWLRAAADPQIGAALCLVHRHPERPWTVGTLAAAAAMSRSSFAARFRDLAGEPPLRYVTRWRMHRAAELLRSGNTMTFIAEAVGYASEAAFSKAFKSWTGTAPGSYRSRARSG